MYRTILNTFRKYRLFLLAGDILIIVIGMAVILYLDDTSPQAAALGASRYLASLVIFPATTALMFYLLGLYDLPTSMRSEVLFFLILLGVALVGLLYSAMAYFLIPLRPGKINLILFFLMTGLLAFGWRIAFQKIVPIKPERLLFIGSEPIFDEIAQVIESSCPNYYTIENRWCMDDYGQQDLCIFQKDNNIDIIVYSLRSELVKQIARDLLTVKLSNKRIIDANSFYQQLTYKCPLQFLDNFSLLVNVKREPFMPGISSNLKRAMDILCVLLALPLALPLLVLTAIAIKLESTGPVLFRQERLGQYEVPFRVYKFRTMADNAERLTGPQWSTETDPRITRVGRILRKLRLDELPQLFNVLKGEMAFVGPRPIRRHFADILAQEVPFYRMRFLAKPGITGWAQVNYDYAGSVEGQWEKQRFDLFYLIHQSIWLDLFIMFKTIRVMVWGKGT